MRRRNFLLLVASLLMPVLASVSLSSCGDDELEPTDVVSNQDPEGTIVLNMHNKNNGGSYYNIGLGTEIRIDGANNFEGYYSGEFVSVGSVSGLSKVNSIPTSGWSRSAAVVPGTGYVARYYYGDTYRYARLYVVDHIVGTTGGIIGATVKYQCPFQLPISLEKTSVSFEAAGGTQTVKLKNPTSVSIDEKPEWVNVSTNIDELTLTASENLGAQQRTGTIELSNSMGKAKLTVTQRASSSPKFEAGSGTQADPYQIRTAQQLENVKLALDAHFVLTADINLASQLNANGSGWDPLGKQETPFTGTFDGQMHTIRGLWINRPTTNYVGLFGYANEATIERIKLQLADKGITGSSRVGGICGWMSGTIRQCSASGSISGKTWVAGICGEGSSSRTFIEECYSDGSITVTESRWGEEGAAGITHYATANNCYSKANLTSNYVCHGIAGGGASISKCYYAGNAKADWNFYCGGSYTYFDSDIVGATFDGSSSSSARTTAQMMSQSNYEGWDFDTVWRITEGRSYPTLRCFE